MIPLQLKIRNFLSYGSQSDIIDFEPHHLICLTGKNGHGKSALLDAITWALWGQARKIAGVTRGDEHFIRLGENNMSVTLDFICNNQRYRVGRDFSIANNKRGVSQLYFGIFKTEIDAYISLTEKNSRDTQEKINMLLGIDYETFINSIFLRQGQSNEFSKKSPLERKEIISTLLGLSRYENLKQRAVEKQRSCEKEYEILGHLINSAKTELSSKEDVARQLPAIDAQLDRLSNLKKEQEQLLQSLKIEQKASSDARTTFTIKLKMVDEQQRIVSNREQRLVEHLRIRRDYFHQKNSLLQKRPAVPLETIRTKKIILEKGRVQLQQLKTDLLTFTHKKQERFTTLAQEFQVIRHKKELELNEILIHHQQSESQSNLLEKKLTEKKELFVEAQKQLAVFLAEATQHKKTTEKAPSRELLLNKATRTLDRWHLLQKNFETEIKKTEANQVQLCATTASACPLCKQNLPHQLHMQLQKDVSKKLTHLTHQCMRLKKIIPAIKNQIALLQKEQNDIAHARELMEKAQRTYEQQEILLKISAEELQYLQKEYTALLKIGADTAALHAEQSQQLVQMTQSHTEKISLDQEIAALTAQISDIEKQVTELTRANFEAQIAECDTLIEEINAYHNEEQILAIKREQYHHQRIEIIQCITEIRNAKKNISELQDEISVMQGQAAGYDAIEQQIKEQENLLLQLQQRQNSCLEQKGALSKQIQLLEKRSEELTAFTEKMAHFGQLKEDYLLLSQALGKNGIQAFIIEQAVPELEQEANLLLSKLTNNQAQVMFESLRDLKSGGTKETLDIKISDAMGIRPYELFSGGEAFRIDFALRIALSKLLARRAGTSLQTLIIDEGFGSQDEEGLALIQEALYMIQDDFEKIIIVSHLPDMKLNFPTNFVVTKNAAGSSVTVVQQG